MTPSPNKKRRGRTPITLETKAAIIRKKETNPGMSHEELARTYNLDRSTISHILKRKEEVLREYESLPGYLQKRTGLRSGKFHLIDEALYRLFSKLRSQHIPVSQDM